MATVERNKPCGCGSGRKAKKCCHSEAAKAAERNRLLLEWQERMRARRKKLAPPGAALRAAAILSGMG